MDSICHILAAVWATVCTLLRVHWLSLKCKSRIDSYFFILFLLQTIREVFVPLLVCQATPEASEALKFCAQTLDMVSAKRFLFTQYRKLEKNLVSKLNAQHY